MSIEKRPGVGVGVVIHDKQGNVVMGIRTGSHGHGIYNFSLSPRHHLAVGFGHISI